VKIQVVADVLKANDAIARRNRERFDELGVLAVNLISSPGSGKTSLLERTSEALKGRFRLASMVGDLETTRDAERIDRAGIASIQINTGKGCHLDAAQVEAAIDKLPLTESDLLFIENVGNLVCPTGFDLGEHAKVTLLSTPEGEDKVLKYPLAFQIAQCILLNKIDLVDVLGYDRTVFYDDLRKVNSAAPVIEISCRRGDGMDLWADWLDRMREDLAEQKH
jgi:hydrogenase nickel incorporation protein HypB